MREAELMMVATDGFDDFVVGQGRGLLRSAWLLTGDWASAEDLVQSTLAKTWRRWPKVREADDAAAYVRRILINTHLGMRRRRWIGERPTADLPETATSDTTVDSDLRHCIRAALAALPPRQRAVVVLRYFCDLTESQTAAELGCSVGTVKSQASRALAVLRSDPALIGVLTTEMNS